MALLKPRVLSYPFSAEQVGVLRAGEMVLVSGLVYTGRDRLHKHLFEGGKCPVDLRNSAIYHCGPVVIRKDEKWEVRAAGPTTSAREEPYIPRIIRDHGVRLFIGKGSLGKVAEQACRTGGCAYLHAVGGAAQLLASKVVAVKGVHFAAEFGAAEALWMLELKEFPAIVAIDPKGRSVLREILAASRRTAAKLIESPDPFLP